MSLAFNKLQDHILGDIYYYSWLRSITEVNKEYHDKVNTSNHYIQYEKDDKYYNRHFFQRRWLDNSKRKLLNQWKSYYDDEYELTLGFRGQQIYHRGKKDNSIILSSNYIYSSGLNDIYSYKQSSINIFGHMGDRYG